MSKWLTTVVLAVLILSFSVTGYSQEIDLSTLLEDVQAPVFLQSSGQTYLPGAAGEQRDGKPPLSAMRITGEFLLGGVGGLAGTYPTIYTYHFLGGEAEDASAVREAVANTMAFGVWSLCYATGVYMVGDLGNETGSFPATICGAVAGVGVWILGILAIDAVIDGEDIGEGTAAIALIFGLTVPTVGAIIGFNLTRRYRSPPAESETALINCRDGKTSLSVPRIYFRTDPFGTGNLCQRVDLLRVRF